MQERCARTFKYSNMSKKYTKTPLETHLCVYNCSGVLVSLVNHNLEKDWVVGKVISEVKAVNNDPQTG